MDSLDWGLETLTGSSLYITTAEVCLCLVMNLTGLLFFSFLLADLTNILCNLDPAANEFKQTVETLSVEEKRFIRPGQHTSLPDFEQSLRQQLELMETPISRLSSEGVIPRETDHRPPPALRTFPRPAGNML